MRTEAEWNVSFRQEASRLTAMLVRQFGPRQLDLIEDSVQETFIRALKAWKVDGPPENYRAWLSLVAKRTAIDRLRREKFYAPLPADDLIYAEDQTHAGFAEDELDLFYLCCHPRLSAASQMILTLREVGGFTTREIARCLFTPEPTIAQRLVRTKRTLHELLPDEDRTDAAARLQTIRRVLYLMFNRGYSFQAEDDPARAMELCDEAIGLTLRLSNSATEDRPTTFALLSLMYLQSSRLSTRLDANGTSLRLEEQDNAKWDQSRIGLGITALAASAEGNSLTAYHIEAAIAAEYATCNPSKGPDWRRILDHYDDLQRLYPSEVVRLNRAIVVGMVHGPGEALRLLDQIKSRGRLAEYHHLESARAFFLDRSQRPAESKAALDKALSLASNEGDRKLLQKRLRSVS